MTDPERFVISMGQAMEQAEDFEAAASCYRQAATLEPTDRNLWYLAHNNLGYSLNQLGRQAEAEPFCRRAIEIDPARHNAHKNLGVALEGQGHPLEAARCYRRAADLRPQDGRAQAHLDALLAAHPEVAEALEKDRRVASGCHTAGGEPPQAPGEAMHG